MKLKCQPADFRVEELTDREPGAGSYSLYRLSKRSLGTLEAIDEIVARWELRRANVSFGGLKDKHAQTRQFITIEGGPTRNLRRDLFHVEYLGRTERPFTSHDIRGNKFQLVMRDLSRPECEFARGELDDVRTTGLPNYFDDQRFGSVGESGEFIALPWCLGNYERTLWLALADLHPDDDPGEREQKRTLQQHWGDWSTCLRLLRRSYRQSIVMFLAGKRTPRDSRQPVTDFRGAVARMKTDLRGLYLAAFQSHLWNRMLAAFLRQTCAPNELMTVPLQLGSHPFPRQLSTTNRESLVRTTLPLPSARQPPQEGPVRTLMESVVGEFGLEIRQLRVKYPRDNFFAKGERPVLLIPSDLEATFAADDLYPGQQRLTLGFELPRGSYATILVKRLTKLADDFV